MGKGGGGGSEAPQFVQSPPLNIPNEQNLQAAAVWRTMAASPWTSSPYRAMDFLFGLPSQAMQVPQFQPAQGQSQFSGTHGGGYSQGAPTGGQPPSYPIMPFFPPPLYANQSSGYGGFPDLGQLIQNAQQPQQQNAQQQQSNSAPPSGQQGSS